MNCKIDCLKSVQSDWYHKWCPLNNYRLYDYVKGPLKFPMVTVPIPYEIKEKDEMDSCNCSQYVKVCYSKSGIPDPWSEYLILRRETEKGRDVSSAFPKCDLDITRYLDRNYRVYLGQGIPDPWKKWTYIESLEPNFDNLKRNWKSCAENLRIGPGCDMYDVDKVCCPNCNRRLLVLCLKKPNQEEKEIEKDIVNTDLISRPIEEKFVQQKIYLKDACIETDSVPGAVQISKACSCKLGKVCGCSNTCSSCPVCNQSKNEEKRERRRCKKNDSCNCKRNYIINGYFYNASQNCPLKNKNTRQYNPVTDQSGSSPLSKIQYARQGSILPFFCSRSDHYGCQAQQFIGFEEKKNHDLELQLICPKCDRKRKKGRKTKCEQRKGNHFPCHCRTKEKESFKKYTNECGEYECDVHNCTCVAPHYKKKIKPKTSCNTDHRCYCKEPNKSRIFEDRDYVRLLEILGCTGLFLKNLNTDCDKPKAARNKISSKGKTQSFPRFNHSYWKDTSDINREGFHNSESEWMDQKYKQYEMSRRSTGTNNHFETVDSRYDSKKQIPRRIPYNSHNTNDELGKMRSRLRRQKNKNAFRKELNYFLCDYGRNGLGNDSESSSKTRTGGKNAETKVRQSSWQKGGNII